MTDAERQAIESAITIARAELDQFDALVFHGAKLANLYEAAKPVHTSALGIWCAVVAILRARRGLDKREPEADAINLNELFGEKENECGNQY